MISSDFRKVIDAHAERLGCKAETDRMSDVEAVRYMQKKEGYTPCFAADQPFKPLEDDSNWYPSDPDLRPYWNKYCDETSCCWHETCNNARFTPVALIDKVLLDSTRTELDSFVQQLVEAKPKCPELLPTNAVGLQIASFRNVSSATKKMLLATPMTIVGESVCDRDKLQPYLLQSRSHIRNGHDGRYGYFVTTCDVLFSSDPLALHKWLQDITSFSQTGELKYQPIIEQVEASKLCGMGDVTAVREKPTEYWRLPKTVPLKTFAAPHTAVVNGDMHLTDPDFVPLLSLELPAIEETDFSILASLMKDYPDELCSFRDFLMSTIEELRNASITSTDFGANCRRAERQIREQLRKVKSDFRKSRLAAAFSLTGCIVANWVLALYCIVEGKGDLLKVIGPGGTVFSLSAAISAYLQKRLEMKDNPAYFLWLIERT